MSDNKSSSDLLKRENPYIPSISIKALLESSAKSAACPNHSFSLSYNSPAKIILVQVHLYPSTLVSLSLLSAYSIIFRNIIVFSHFLFL